MLGYISWLAVVLIKQCGIFYLLRTFLKFLNKEMTISQNQCGKIYFHSIPNKRIKFWVCQYLLFKKSPDFEGSFLKDCVEIFFKLILKLTET
jgi:hypothetical protein